jgi:hypothetical protein
MSHEYCTSSTGEFATRNQSNALQEDPDTEENIRYRITPASEITEEQWDVYAATLSEHYVVWSEGAQFESGRWAVPGT